MEKTFKLNINFDHIRFLLKRNRRFIILMLVTMIVFNPILVIMLGTLIDISTGLLIAGKVFNILLAMLSSFIVASIMFSYLNNKTAIDLYHSLPIDRKSLHFTIYLAGLVILLIPFTISWALAIPLHLLVDNPQIWETIIGYIYVILPLISIYTIIIYVQINTGTTVDSMLYAFIVLFLPFFAYLTYFAYGNALLLGFNQLFDWNFLSYLSPFVAIFHNTINNLLFSSYLIFNQLYWIIVNIVIYWITIKIYQVRQSEKTQMPFTNNSFFPIVSISAIILVQILLYSFFYVITYDTSMINVFSLVLSVLISAVLYMILDAVASRSFKNILKAGLKYLIISLFVALITIPVNITKSFGFITHIPNNIESVSVSFYDNLGLIHESGKKDFYFYNQSYQPTFTFNVDKEIKVITDLHQTILNHYQYYDYNEENFLQNYTNNNDEPINPIVNLAYNSITNITIDYHLNNGSIMSRQYTVNYNWLAGLLDLYQHEEFIKGRIPMAYYHDIITKIDNIYLSDKLQTNLVKVSNEFDFHEFAKLYLEDYQNMTKEQLLSVDYEYYGQLSANICRVGENNLDYCTGDYLDLDSRLPKAMAYLEDTQNPIVESNIDGLIRVIFPDEFNELPFFKIANYDYYYENVNNQMFRYTDITTDQLNAMLPYLVPRGISQTQTLVVALINNNYGNANYLLNPSYYDQAKELLKDNPVKFSTDIYEILFNEQLYKD